jgi:hypothetical protein
MDSHEPDFIVVGEKVALGPLRRDLAACYARWMNQLEVRRGLDQMGIATPESQEKWVEENIEKGAMRAPQVVEFTVYDRTDSAPVGTAGLLDIGHANGTAEFAIIIASAAARVWAPRPRGSCSTHGGGLVAQMARLVGSPRVGRRASAGPQPSPTDQARRPRAPRQPTRDARSCHVLTAPDVPAVAPTASSRAARTGI